MAFVRGEVADLPFRDAAFTLVLSRFALHHLTDPCAALAEIIRVCQARERVVMDLVASTDPRVAEQQDRIERLRDPSHVRMPPRGSVRPWLADQGLVVDVVAEQEIDPPVLGWLEQAARTLRRPRWYPRPSRRSLPAVRGPECDRTGAPTVRCGSANIGSSPRRDGSWRIR